MMNVRQGDRTERLLHLTLEIIYLLTEQDYGPMKKFEEPTSEQHESNKPIMELDTKNEQKILNLTKKITHLVTGEVPIRCQDVTVYFSMEEWDYIEGHKDLYEDVIMEKIQTLTSLAKVEVSKGLLDPLCLNRFHKRKRI
ncbi:gastrula zinc finger protein XlCGF66.1-like [Ranitomeya variabilis]|uniref:gastrula zinc finger protein XlCGF66.1-like n=1 Tax=Ranitomeya variabilis TaxID=490064 RepID=UPI0040576853